ncbi:hypothetical protein DIU36_20095 [Mucilaginibacter rubeus]|nr:hypothetical protein DIU36_20095 [Mucilaginibacter rubeus]
MILLISCGKGTSDTLDNMNNGGHINIEPTNKGAVTTTSVDSVTSGHAVIKGELVSLPELQTAVHVGFVWDTKSHANIADYPNQYFTLGKQSAGKIRFKRAGFAGGTTYYIRVVARAADFDPVIYGKELSFTTKPSSMEYGESINGGILFYVDGSGKHGLVADLDALVYNFGGGPKWIGDNNSGALFTTGKAIGTGNANTNKIVSQYGTSPIIAYAALTCYNLDKNGYSDWYLPSIDELSQLKKNLYDTPLGLAPGHFWSSTTTLAGYAWCLGTDAVSDAPDQFLISSYATVCAVRSF